MTSFHLRARCRRRRISPGLWRGWASGFRRVGVGYRSPGGAGLVWAGVLLGVPGFFGALRRACRSDHRWCLCACADRAAGRLPGLIATRAECGLGEPGCGRRFKLFASVSVDDAAAGLLAPLGFVRRSTRDGFGASLALRLLSGYRHQSWNLRRPLGPVMMTTSARCRSRSSSAEVSTLSLLKVLGHSLNLRFVVRIVELRS